MWIISNALMKACENLHCSQALVEESSEDTCWDGEQSAQLSGNHTQLAYLPPDKMTAFSRLSRFGMTFKPLTADLGEELLTLFREASLARTYPVQAKEQESKEADQACGSTWQELSVKYDPDSHSWRTHQCLWDEALQWSLVTLPKWGMTVSGVLFQHPTAERPISGTGSGLWLTPRASDVGKGESNHTFIARMGDRTDNCAQSLAAQVNNPKTWPTPFPTPTANEDAAGTPTGKMQNMLGNDPRIRGTTKTEWDAGTLNPTWVEWLMGWPLGWTDLKPLAMDRFQAWQQQHGGY